MYGLLMASRFRDFADSLNSREQNAWVIYTCGTSSTPGQPCDDDHKFQDFQETSFNPLLNLMVLHTHVLGRISWFLSSGNPMSSGRISVELDREDLNIENFFYDMGKAFRSDTCHVES